MSGAMGKRTREIVAFIVLTYALAWSLWVSLARGATTVGPGMGWPSHLPGLLAPALAAIVVTGASDGREGLRRLFARVRRVRPRGPMANRIIVLLALTVCAVALPIFERPRPSWDAFVTYSGAPRVGVWVVPYVLIVNGLGEELGFRGFLADALLPRLGGLRTAFVTWLVWAAWHLPLFFVVDTFRALGTGGALAWLVGIGCGALVLTWLYEASGRSVIIPALWHTAYNFATATAASSMLSSGFATVIVVGVSVGLVRHRGFWVAVRSPRGIDGAS